MSLEDLYQSLEKLSDFENEDNLIPFIETVEKIVSYQDPSCFPIILKYFDDDTDYTWIMQSMIHALESFPKEIYVSEIIKNLNISLKFAPYWTETIFNRIFNDELYLKCFIENMNLSSIEHILQLLNLVANESEHHKELCENLKKLISEGK